MKTAVVEIVIQERSHNANYWLACLKEGIGLGYGIGDTPSKAAVDFVTRYPDIIDRQVDRYATDQRPESVRESVREDALRRY